MRWLVDTSVWIDHLRSGNARLIELLREDSVLIHPAVIGELACGTLRKRAETLANLRLLPRAPEASLDEVLHFIDEHHLHGRGIGWVDAQLLASAALSDASLWTLDARLASVIRGGK